MPMAGRKNSTSRSQPQRNQRQAFIYQRQPHSESERRFQRRECTAGLRHTLYASGAGPPQRGKGACQLPAGAAGSQVKVDVITEYHIILTPGIVYEDTSRRMKTRYHMTGQHRSP